MRAGENGPHQEAARVLLHFRALAFQTKANGQVLGVSCEQHGQPNIELSEAGGEGGGGCCTDQCPLGRQEKSCTCLLLWNLPCPVAQASACSD